MSTTSSITAPTAVVPRVVVTVDGAELGAAAASRLVSLRVHKVSTHPGQCELVLKADRTASTSAELPAEIGSAVRVTVIGDRDPVFTGTVTAVEHRETGAGRTRRVRAYDGLHRLRKTRHIRVFDERSPLEIAEEITGAVGLELDASDATVSLRDQVPMVVQTHETDLDLLRRVTAAHGCSFAAEGDRVRIFAVDRHVAATEQLHLGEDLLDVSVTVNADQPFRSVDMQGWQPSTMEFLRAVVDAPTSSDDESDVPKRLGTDGIWRVVGRTSPSADTLAAGAGAELARLVDAEHELVAIGEGRSSIKPGTIVEIDGLDPAVPARFLIGETVHTVDGSGYVMELRTSPRSAAAPENTWALTPGVVRDVADPQHLGRVRVSLPAYDSIEPGWLPMLFPGAGADRGIVAIPNPGDLVLVALDAVSSAPIVLGGLYGGNPPPSTVAESSVAAMTWRTRPGHEFTLDDARGATTLRIVSGSSLTLGPDSVVLHAASDLLIEAPGHALRIRAKSVDFEEAP